MARDFGDIFQGSRIAVNDRKEVDHGWSRFGWKAYIRSGSSIT